MRQVRRCMPGQGHQHQATEVANAPRRPARLASSHRPPAASSPRKLALLRTLRGARLVLGGRADAPANGGYSLPRGVPSRCLPQAMALAHPFKIALACSSVISLAKPRASRRLRPRSLSCGAFLRSQAPVFVRPPQARSRETRYVCVLIAPGAVAPEASNTFSQVTAPRITPLATRRALKRRRIAFPARLRSRARASLPPACGPARASRPLALPAGACNAFASAAFRACFTSVEALLTRTLSGRPRTLEPTMQTVQTDRSTLAR